MATEIALIDVIPGHEVAFIEAVDRNIDAIRSHRGAHSANLLRCLELPTRFVLHVEWTDIAAHNDFRETEAFARWRADVSSHLAAPPDAAHYHAASTS
jgi:quinol monooxygenase YgiN